MLTRFEPSHYEIIVTTALLQLQVEGFVLEFSKSVKHSAEDLNGSDFEVQPNLKVWPKADVNVRLQVKSKSGTGSKTMGHRIFEKKHAWERIAILAFKRDASIAEVKQRLKFLLERPVRYVNPAMPAFSLKWNIMWSSLCEVKRRIKKINFEYVGEGNWKIWKKNREILINMYSKRIDVDDLIYTVNTLLP